MKKILLLTVAIMAFFAAQAQSVRFVHNGEVLETGAVISISELQGTIMAWEPIIRNTTDQSQTVTVSVDVIANTYGDATVYPMTDQLTMCDANNCYSPMVTELDPFTLSGGEETSHNFHAQFTIMSSYLGYTDAYAEATYYLMNVNNEDDFTYVTVKFEAQASVDKTLLSTQANMFQRGGNLVCNYKFDTAADRNIVVSNIVGARVASVALDGNNGEVVLQRLPKGVYVYTLVENGRNIQSRKIVVR